MAAAEAAQSLPDRQPIQQIDEMVGWLVGWLDDERQAAGSSRSLINVGRGFKFIIIGSGFAETTVSNKFPKGRKNKGDGLCS